MKLTGDFLVGGGNGGGLGLFVNLGLEEGESFDFGITGNIDTANPGQFSDVSEAGGGLDISVGLEAGYLEGSAENLNGSARNINFGAGEGLGGSYTNTETSNGASGHAVALEAGLTPLSASTTTSEGFKYGVQDAIRDVTAAVVNLLKNDEKPK